MRTRRVAGTALTAIVWIILLTGASATTIESIFGIKKDDTLNYGQMITMGSEMNHFSSVDNIINHFSSLSTGNITKLNATLMKKTKYCQVKEPAFIIYINKAINKIFSKQPVFKLLELRVTRKREIQIRWIDGGTLQLKKKIIDRISIGYGCNDKNSPKKYIGYRKLYCTKKNKNGHCPKRKLAAIFINLDKLFPCAKKGHKTIAHAFSYEEDGFNQGKALLEAADTGGDFEIFGKGVNTYGITIQDCPLMFGYAGCLPGGFSKIIVVALPRACFCA